MNLAAFRKQASGAAAFIVAFALVIYTMSALERGNSYERRAVVDPGQIEADGALSRNEQPTRRIRGKVVDSRGIGIDSARIKFIGDSTHSIAVRSTAGGAFDITVAGGQSPIELEVSATGYVSSRRSVAMTENVVISLDKSGSLEGLAVDRESHIPLHQFSISFFSPGTVGRTDAPLRTESIESENGDFRVLDIEQDEVDVLARAPGYEPIYINGVVVSDRTYLGKLEFTSGRTISGRVASATNGSAIADAEVTAAAEVRMPLPGQSTTTAADGSFALNELRSAPVLLHVRADGFAMSTVRVPANESDVLVAMQPAGSISGQIIEFDGTSPGKGSVAVVDRSSGNSFRRRADQFGHFSVEGLSASEYSIKAQSTTGYSEEKLVKLDPAGSVLGLRLEIQRGSEVTGVVSGLLDGEELLGVSAARSGITTAATEVDSAGSYKLTGLPSGSVEVTAKTTKGRSISGAIELRANEPAYLDFLFDASSRAHGRVTGDGTSVKYVTVEFVPIDERRPRGRARTSDTGEYLIEGLSDGEHLVKINGSTMRSVQVNGDVRVDFEM